jgi:hypothetical protein
MHVIESAVVVGRSIGENDVYIINNMITGSNSTIHNPNGIALELGQEGTLTYKKDVVNNFISFEPSL